jgi:hypothetical protein
MGTDMGTSTSILPENHPSVGSADISPNEEHIWGEIRGKVSEVVMAKNTSKVVARLTITRKGSSKKTIIEVHENASFTQFYKWFTQEGRRRKRFMRTSNRNEGIRVHCRAPYETPGLHRVAESLASFQKDIESVNIKVLSKRKYNQLLNCAPDQLSGKLPVNNQRIKHWSQVVGRRPQPSIRVQFPTGRLTLQQRMDILTGVK